MINQRNKGKRLELDRVNWQKSIGQTEACTTRNCSKKLDDMGVDLTEIPIAEQCKNGYSSGLNYVDILTNMEKKLSKNEQYNKSLKVIIHKSGRSFYCAVMRQKEFQSHFGKQNITLQNDCSFVSIDFKKNLITIDIDKYNSLVKQKYEKLH